MKTTIFAALTALTAIGGATLNAVTDTPSHRQLNDLEMAHVAVTANNIDIAYAHLALAFSENPRVREFAETMIRDHSAVNAQVFALAERLGVTAQDNDMSRELLAKAKTIKDELSQLRGAEFDRNYVENEAGYHEVVNGVVAETFIPNAQNPEVKKAFEAALRVFLVHQAHAEAIDSELNGS